MALFNFTSTNPQSVNLPQGPLTGLFEDSFEQTILQYPSDLSSSSQTSSWKPHVVKFFINVPLNSSFLSSGAYNVSVGTTTPGSDEPPLQKQQTLLNVVNITPEQKRVAGSISLYMPSSMNFDFNLGYSDVELGQEKIVRFGQIGKTVADNLSNSDVGSISDLTNLISTYSGTKAKSDAASALPYLFAGLSGGALSEGLAGTALKGSGLALNPQVQLLFTAVSLRTFQMEFTFSPKTQYEAQIVQQIIQTFRFHAAPEVGGASVGDKNGLFFVVPSTFNIEFLFEGSENPYLQRIGECVLENISVNYAPNGEWATFYDGSPTQTTLTLQFKETDIIEKKDIAAGF